MPSKDRGKSDDKKSAKGQAAAGAAAPKGKYAAENLQMEGKPKKAKAHKDKRGRGTK